MIVTKWLGPTDKSPARIIAKTGHNGLKRVVYKWDHALNESDNHDEAAKTCFNKHFPPHFRGVWVRSRNLDGTGFTYFEPRSVEVVFE